MNEIEKQSPVPDDMTLFYSAYVNKANKETLHTLMYGMSFSEFMIHRNFLEAQAALETAYYKDEELKNRK